MLLYSYLFMKQCKCSELSFPIRFICCPNEKEEKITKILSVFKTSEAKQSHLPIFHIRWTNVMFVLIFFVVCPRHHFSE